MVAKERNFEPSVVQESNDHLQDCDDADEETLSLCDLPLDSFATDLDDFSGEQHTSTSLDEDFFEFMSQEFTASTYPTDNIVFCGKLIPYKGEGVAVAGNAHGSDGGTVRPRESKKNRVVPWKSQPLVSKSSKRADNYAFPMKKVSILAAPMKSRRWYLFAFGVGRFPMEMELRDIRTRQSKKGQGKMFQSEDKGETVQKGRRIGKSLWKLLRTMVRLVK